MPMHLHVIFLVLALFVSGHVKAAEYKTLRPSVDELTRQFEAVVFGQEFSRGTPSRRLKKWAGPLRVAVKAYSESKDDKDTPMRRLQQVAVNPEHLRYVQNHLSTLARLTGLNTEDFKTTEEPANFTIKFVPGMYLSEPSLIPDVSPKLLRKLGAQGGCYFLTWHNDAAGHIEKVEIVVNADRSGLKIEHCLLEEMFQSLGLFNDSAAEWDTIFSNTMTFSSRPDAGQIIVSLPRSDRIIIKALYDKRLRPAMDRSEVMILARKIIGELNRSMP